MIYLVTKNSELFEATEYKIIGVDESLSLLYKESILQVDSETMGRNAHICNLLSFQFGSINKEWQLVIDCTTINIILYKQILEEKLLIGHNLKFDLQFLYNYNIIPRRVYDTMIVEQLLYLGYMYIPISPKEYEFFNYTFPYLIEDNPKKKSYGKYTLSFSLKAVAYKYLKVNLDKTIRGEIIWRGLTTSTIVYAAHDTVYLYDIMVLQIKECKARNCLEGMKLECSVVPAMAYLEWCGIMLDEDKWKDKMTNDAKLLGESKQALDNFVTSNPDLSEFTYVERQGNLFTGFSLDPICTINWSSSTQVAKLAKKLGFDTVVKDKRTGQDKDSVLEKHLKPQVGINDEFLKLYFDYQEHSKVVSSFGQGHLNAINPITGRIHTTYYQLGTKSGNKIC